jgi:hypothetical protein
MNRLVILLVSGVLAGAMPEGAVAENQRSEGTVMTQFMLMLLSGVSRIALPNRVAGERGWKAVQDAEQEREARKAHEERRRRAYERMNERERDARKARAEYQLEVRKSLEIRIQEASGRMDEQARETQKAQEERYRVAEQRMFEQQREAFKAREEYQREARKVREERRREAERGATGAGTL